MKRKTWVAAAALAATAWAAPAASAQTVYGLTDSDKVVAFDLATPETVSTPTNITGLTAGTTLKGIDVRPATLQLYALGSDGQLYVVDTVTGAATKVGSPVTLSGTNFDIDFNPTVDRLRVVSDANQNLRINPNNGALASADPNLTPAAGVTGAAYTDNAPSSYAFPSNPTTELLDIDTASDQLFRQSPANNGTLVNGKPLGVDLVGDVGFDVVSRSSNTGDVEANAGYVVGRTADGNDRFYNVDIGAGPLTEVGEVGGSDKVKDIAIAAPVPLVAVLTTPSVPSSAQLLGFYRADRPGTVITTVTISGLQAGERLVGIDRNATNGLLYGVGDTSRIYTINPANGQATVVGAGPFAPALSGGRFGVDFNPAANRLRVVSDTGQNLRLNQLDGTSTSPTGDTNLAYDAADPNAMQTPHVTAAGYTNSGVTGGVAPSTTLFDLDTGLDILVTQTPANNGTLQSRGALGVPVTDDNGYDIVARFNQQFAALTPQNPLTDGPSALYNIAGAGSPANGTVAKIGTIAGIPALSTIAGMSIITDDVLPPAPTPVATPTPTPTVTATPTYTVPTPTPTPAYPVKRKRPGLKVIVRPKNDKKSPFRFTARGKVILPKGIGKGKGCKGSVRFTLRRKGSGKPLSTTRKSVKSNCKYKVKTGFSKNRLKKSQRAKGKLKAKVRFQGNAVLKPKRVIKQVSYGRKGKK